MSRKSAIYEIVNHNPNIPIIPNRDKYKLMIPVITDTHILMKEPTNRTNFVPTTLSYIYNLADIFKENGIKYAIHAGDLFDRGDNSTNTLIRNTVEDALNELTKDLEGAYIVYGNHEHTYFSNNLFFSYTSINSSVLDDIIGSKYTLTPVRPFFQAIDKLDLGDVQIHFMHFDKLKRYSLPNDKFNICIFHEDLISFDSKVELYHHKLGHGIDIVNTNIFENVDIAICAHIHTPLLPFRLGNERNTLVITPGSLCHRTVAERHTKVDLPVICLNDDGVFIEYIDFNLGDVEETIIEDIEEQRQRVYKSTKALKEFKKAYSNIQDLQDLLNNLPAEQANILRISDKPIYTSSMLRYYGMEQD